MLPYWIAIPNIISDDEVKEFERRLSTQEIGTKV